MFEPIIYLEAEEQELEEQKRQQYYTLQSLVEDNLYSEDELKQETGIDLDFLSEEVYGI